MLILALASVLALPIGLPPQEAARQPGIQPYHVEWENDDLRIARVVLGPGEHVTADSPAGSVIVYMTANLDGRMPAADAVWQAAGPLEMDNRGRARFEALVVQFKRTVPASAPAAAAASPYSSRGTMPSMMAWGGYGYVNWMDYSYREPVKSETLVDTAGVTVTKVRQPPSMYLSTPEIDANDRVVVYLRRGYAWPSVPSFYGAVPVHRGDVRVLAGNAPYTLSNPGSDPSEFIVIARR
jgi:hypothetical protein